MSDATKMIQAGLAKKHASYLQEIIRKGSNGMDDDAYDALNELVELVEKLDNMLH